MKMSGGPASVNIKLFLLVMAFLIASGTLFYTQNLVERLQQRERQIVELYANTLKYIADSPANNSDFTFIFENIVKRIDFPLILTDENNNVNLTGVGGGIRNIEIDSTLSPAELEAFVDEKLDELESEHEPIPVVYGNSIFLGRIYYGDSDLIRRLRYYPYFQIFFAFLFILIAYVSFSYLKRNEQSNIWVGMAKETAHQLGTPISSIMGWLEMLKIGYKNPDKVLNVTKEIDNDLDRLNKVTKRFSKIGSLPELKEYNVSEEIKKVISYFRRRLPQTGKNVILEINSKEEIKALINPDLFEWVIENLIKNALDAIEQKKGKISFNINQNGKNVEIEVSDTGKGIDLKRRKDIFRPGYSTKRRGWGLGLSLSKRIIEDYHDGKIFVKNSVINEGTTFKIILKK